MIATFFSIARILIAAALVYSIDSTSSINSWLIVGVSKWNLSESQAHRTSSDWRLSVVGENVAKSIAVVIDHMYR